MEVHAGKEHWVCAHRHAAAVALPACSLGTVASFVVTANVRVRCLSVVKKQGCRHELLEPSACALWHVHSLMQRVVFVHRCMHSCASTVGVVGASAWHSYWSLALARRARLRHLRLCVWLLATHRWWSCCGEQQKNGSHLHSRLGRLATSAGSSHAAGLCVCGDVRTDGRIDEGACKHALACTLSILPWMIRRATCPRALSSMHRMHV